MGKSISKRWIVFIWIVFIAVILGIGICFWSWFFIELPAVMFSSTFFAVGDGITNAMLQLGFAIISLLIYFLVCHVILLIVVKMTR